MSQFKKKIENRKISKPPNEEPDEPDSVITKNNKSELPTVTVKFSKTITTFDDAWTRGKPQILNKLSTRLTERANLKVVIGMEVVASKPTPEGKETTTVYPKTRPIPIYSIEQARQILEDYKDTLEDTVIETIEKLIGSNWTVEQFVSMFIVMYSQKPARGSSYIETPTQFKNPKCGLINIKNNDNECFKYCLLYHQSKQGDHDARVTALKKIEDKYNWTGINFPVSFDDITLFEELNQVCINVYGITEGQVNPIRLGNINYIPNDNINLLLLIENENGHYVYIKK